MDIQSSSTTVSLQASTGASATSVESKAAVQKQPEEASAPETKQVAAKVEGGSVLDIQA